jgi:hypothetical protein
MLCWHTDWYQRIGSLKASGHAICARIAAAWPSRSMSSVFCCICMKIRALSWKVSIERPMNSCMTR